MERERERESGKFSHTETKVEANFLGVLKPHTHQKSATGTSLNSHKLNVKFPKNGIAVRIFFRLEIKLNTRLM